MIKLKAKANDGTKLFERKQGDKLSANGCKARELLEIDHRHPEKTTKTHNAQTACGGFAKPGNVIRKLCTLKLIIT
jgi:hypothetical protein